MNDIIGRLELLIAERQNSDAGESYVASLFAKGRGKIAQKLGEEATETIIAALTQTPGDPMTGDPMNSDLTNEAADLIFHLLILLGDAGVRFDDVLAELARREGVSGLTEKAARKKD